LNLRPLGPEEGALRLNPHKTLRILNDCRVSVSQKLQTYVTGRCQNVVRRANGHNESQGIVNPVAHPSGNAPLVTRAKHRFLVALAAWINEYDPKLSVHARFHAVLPATLVVMLRVGQC
jgi:hypothetical protein